jgi:transposase
MTSLEQFCGGVTQIFFSTLRHKKFTKLNPDATANLVYKWSPFTTLSSQNFTCIFAMHPLSSDKINNIIVLLQAGHSTRHVAQQTGVGCGTVARIRSQHCSEVPCPVAGRPKSLTPRDINHGIRLIMSQQVDTATQVARELRDITNRSVSSETVRRELKNAGMKAVVKQKRPLLSKKHRRARLKWAQTHKDWTVEDWKSVAWSDESKVNRLGSDGRQWVWKKAKENLNDRLVQGTLKFGGGSLMVWGCMLWEGVGNLVRIDGGLDAPLYCRILEEDLTSSVDWYGKTVADIIFQQDNDPKHTSKLAKETMKKMQLKVLPWPSQSADLNPIEHLWQHLKSELAKYSEPPTSIRQLWDRVEEVWRAIDPEICQNLILSMPRRVAAVLEAKGGHTKY